MAEPGQREQSGQESVLEDAVLRSIDEDHVCVGEHVGVGGKDPRVGEVAEALLEPRSEVVRAQDAERDRAPRDDVERRDRATALDASSDSAEAPVNVPISTTMTGLLSRHSSASETSIR